MRVARTSFALGLLAALVAGCTSGGQGKTDGQVTGPSHAYHVAVHTEGVPAEKVAPLVDGAVALLQRRIGLGGYSSFHVEKLGDGRIRLTIADSGAPPTDDVRLLVKGEAALAFRAEASVEAYRGAVYPRKAPKGYRWFTKPIDPKDVIEGASYRILAEEAPVVTGRETVLAEVVPSTSGAEVLITLTPAAMAALQAVLARQSRGTRIAITVNDVLVAMPQFGSRIEGSDVTLSGAYDDARAQAIAAGLNAAIIPPHLELLTEQTLGPPASGAAPASAGAVRQ